MAAAAATSGDRRAVVEMLGDAQRVVGDRLTSGDKLFNNVGVSAWLLPPATFRSSVLETVISSCELPSITSRTSDLFSSTDTLTQKYS